MRLTESHLRFLDGECSPAEEAEIRAEIASSPELSQAIENHRRLEDHLRGACREKLSGGHRQAIWSRFDAEVRKAEDGVETESAPMLAGPGSSERDFPWRFLAVPVAAAAAFLLLFASGIFDPGGTEKGESPVEGPWYYGESPVVDSVLASDRELRDQINNEAEEAEYRRSVKDALVAESLMKCFFGENSRATKRSHADCQEFLSDCSKKPVQVSDLLPDCANIDAVRVYDIELEDGTKLRVPQLFVTGDCGRRLSVHVVCGSQSEIVEKALRTKRKDFKLEADRPTSLCDGADGCSVSFLKKGNHLLLIVSNLPGDEQSKFLQRF